MTFSATKKAYRAQFQEEWARINREDPAEAARLKKERAAQNTQKALVGYRVSVIKRARKSKEVLALKEQNPSGYELVAAMFTAYLELTHLPKGAKMFERAALRAHQMTNNVFDGTIEGEEYEQIAFRAISTARNGIKQRRK